MEELSGRSVTGSPMRFSESSEKTSHTVSHSRLISVMSFCKLVWKEEVVKVIEALIYKDVKGLRTGSYRWG